MTSRKKIVLWIVWLLLTALAAAFMISGMFFGKVAQSPVRAQARSLFSPAALSHGHAQIKMQCTACHGDKPFNAGVDEKACVSCHQRNDDNKAENTHPKSKFEDPANVDRLKIIAADKCVTCHKEHQPGAINSLPGVTQPTDFCVACHKNVAKDTPSHAGMSFESCTSCHSYHDNRSTYRHLLKKNIGVGDPADRVRAMSDMLSFKPAISAVDPFKNPHGTGHVGDCKTCHAAESHSFDLGKHGVSRANGLPVMTPGQSDLSFKTSAHDKKLTCTSCHQANQPNARWAAVDACMTCHNDQHSKSFESSKHGVLWRAEVAGKGKPGSGVSCATCHMPRMKADSIDDIVRYTTNHNQTENLRPAIKQGKVCLSCHSLQFTLDALADKTLVNGNYNRAPSVHIKSIEMEAKRK